MLEVRADPGNFSWEGPDSRDNHMFNDGQAKLLCEQR